jgi:HNH endonuclease
MARRPRYTEQQVRDAVGASPSLAQALRRLGLRAAGGNFETLKKLITEYGIPTDHFDPSWTVRDVMRRRATPLDEVLVENSDYDRRSLKRRLYESGLKRRRCEMCGQGEEWRGSRMALVLDHINGVATDNRLENLRIVCPNCAATLETHCGRKNSIRRLPRECERCGAEFLPKRDSQRYCSRQCGIHHNHGRHAPKPQTRKVERPLYEQLLQDVESMSMLAVGRKYGVSSNAVRKWLRWYERAGDHEKNHGEVDDDDALDTAA